MGDIVESMKSNHAVTYKSLKSLVEEANDLSDTLILSPLTITLGDEFQGVSTDFEAAITLLFEIDERSRLLESPLKLRFSAVYGLISTPINKELAHGMIGEGLQQARELVSAKKRGQRKFQIDTGQPDIDFRLNGLFHVIESISNRWKRDDFVLINEMIKEENDQNVGDLFQKTRQQIYKRRKTLLIEEYRALKSLALFAAKEIGH